MPVTSKQLEQIRELGREYRAKQDTFIRKWHEEQRRIAESADANDNQTMTRTGAAQGARVYRKAIHPPVRKNVLR
jgi:hypothetical protein